MILHDTYTSLLADISILTGFSEIRESWWTVSWCLTEAPALDKHVLRSVEQGSNLDLALFPEQLRRLARRSLVDPRCMRALRQVLLFCYKMEIEFSDAQLKSAFAQFEQTNRQVQQFGESLGRQSPRLLGLVRSLCQSVLFKCRFRDILPKHGPGAVTTSKERWSHVYETIEALYPYSDYFANQCISIDDKGQAGPSHDHLEWDTMEHGREIVAKLIAVPKDSRGPRLICVHPAEAVWIQQGLRCELERAIGLPRSFGTWPRGHIRFDDQTVNGRIALLSSNSGLYATLDLKEASDRISDTLVQALFGPYYKWFGCCRAQKYTVDGKVAGDLYCYAPMGNATTFPVQSLVFWAICVACLIDMGVTPSNQVFVFGDDLLVPSKFASEVVKSLGDFGLVVNQDKSFWNGTFRESCGVDAYQGVDTTPIRWKMRLVPDTYRDLQSLSDLAMRLRMAGYERAAVTSYAHLARMLNDCGQAGVRLYKTTNVNHGSIAEWVKAESYVWEQDHPDLPLWGSKRSRRGVVKWSASMHRFYSRCIRLEEQLGKPTAHGWNHVLESVISLERFGRSRIPDRLAPRRVRLKRGWTEMV